MHPAQPVSHLHIIEVPQLVPFIHTVSEGFIQHVGNSHQAKPGGGFKQFLFSSQKLVKIPISDEYFSDGLKPPTRKRFPGRFQKKWWVTEHIMPGAIDDDAYSDFCRIVPVMCWKNDLHQLAMYKNRATKRESYHLVGGFKYIFLKYPYLGEMIQC